MTEPLVLFYVVVLVAAIAILNAFLTLFHSDVPLQLAELRTERSSLAERLHNAEKTSEQQQQELQRQLRSAEQNVQLRERDLMHVHQQYQLLYQQCVLLQQQSPSWTVRFSSIYIQISVLRENLPDLHVGLKVNIQF